MFNGQRKKTELDTNLVNSIRQLFVIYILSITPLIHSEKDTTLSFIFYSYDFFFFLSSHISLFCHPFDSIYHQSVRI